MLIEFTVGNYRSFHERQTLSLLATRLRDKTAQGQQCSFRQGKYDLLYSAAIYGANASGKSNLVRAMMFLRTFVLTSATRLQAGDPIDVERFALSTGARKEPAYFQIVFLADGRRYRYGMEVDEERVHAEWLYHAKQRETRLFIREGDEFDISSRLRLKRSKDITKRTRPNALFLSVLAQFNHPLGGTLLNWFRKGFQGIHGLNDESYGRYTIERIERDPLFRKRVQSLLRLADVGIIGIGVESVPLASLDSLDIPNEMKDTLRNLAEALHKNIGREAKEVLLKRAITTHEVFDNHAQEAGTRTFDLNKQESEGTKKFFYLLGPWLDTLEQGSVLVVDEMDARLHPLLTRELISMFHSPKSNPNHAQLIFVTHDAALLGERILRRDQVWFTEKDRYGATQLYSLAELKERNDASFYKNYLLGLYGAIPHISSLRPFVEQEMQYGTHLEAEREEETTG